jgi:hypothetical protein
MTLTIVFINLRMAGLIDWHWAVVFTPFWISFGY